MWNGEVAELDNPPLFALIARKSPSFPSHSILNQFMKAININQIAAAAARLSASSPAATYNEYACKSGKEMYRLPRGSPEPQPIRAQNTHSD